MFNPSLRCSAFSGTHRIASGELRHVAMKAKQAFDASPERPVLVFDDADARTLELPLELPAADLLAWLSRPQPQVGGAPEQPRRPGRPKLGVVPREVTLLPRHWDWLAAQPGGASVALRKLVETQQRAWAHLKTNPDDGVEAMIRQRPDARLDRVVTREQIRLTIEFFDTPASAGRPIGWQAEADWTAALRSLEAAGAIRAGWRRVRPGPAISAPTCRGASGR